MNIKAEIREAIRNGATPLFLIGLMELYSVGDNQEKLIKAITDEGSRLYLTHEEKVENETTEPRWKNNAVGARARLRVINGNSRRPRPV